MISIYDIKEDSVESIVCKEIHKLTPQPLPLETMYLVDIVERGSKVGVNNSFENSFLPKLIQKRFEVIYDRQVSKRVCLLLGLICENPGVAVMMVHYLQYLSKINDDYRTLGLHTLSNLIPYYKNEFFSQEDLGRIWKSQKVGPLPIGTTDNLVDIPKAYQSLILNNNNHEESKDKSI